MPTQFNSDETQSDAKQMAQSLAAPFIEAPIEHMRQQFEDALVSYNEDDLSDITRQNLQARIRGVILMGLANQTGALLLTTGNKSELAMGYATLYGDMCGGLNIIGDLFKTQVVELAEYMNTNKAMIPERIIFRPPSAELAYNQKDDDTLPPYLGF